MRIRVPSTWLRTLVVLAAAGLVTVLFVPRAHAVSIDYTVSAFSIINDTQGAFTYSLSLFESTSSVDLVEDVPVSIPVQTFRWDIITDGTSNGVFTTVVDRNLTVGGAAAQTIDQDFLGASNYWSFGGYYLKSGGFYPAPALTFDLGPVGLVDVTLTYFGFPSPPSPGFVNGPYIATVPATFLLHDVPIPEPSTALLLAGGLAALAAAKRGRSTH